jgi:uncharacterized Rossmann fold enzyme
MKKLLAIVTGVVFVALVSCGPSAEEKQKLEEQAKLAADSAANALLEQASSAVTTVDSAATAVVDSAASHVAGH